MKVNGFIESFYTLKVDDNFFESRILDKQNPVEREEIFRTKSIISPSNKQKSNSPRSSSIEMSSKTNSMKNTNKIGEEYTQIVLKGDPVAIICQNINNYMGGVEDIWKKSKDQLGIEFYNPNANPEVKIDFRVIFFKLNLGKRG